MAVLPAEMLSDARQLLDGATSEVRWRTAASRAHFAALAHVKGHESAQQPVIEATQSVSRAATIDKHSPGFNHALLKRMIMSGNRRLIEAAQNLARLYALRWDADISPKAPFGPRQASTSLALAESVFSLLPPTA